MSDAGSSQKPPVEAALAHAFAERDRWGEEQGVLARLTDITQVTVDQQALRRTDTLREVLARTEAQFVWGTGPYGLVNDAPEWRAFTGQTLAELKGMGWADAVHPDDRQRAAAAWADAVDTKQAYESEFRARHHAGGYRWLQVRALPVLEEDGSVQEWIGVAMDVTEKKQIEQALETTNDERFNETQLRERPAITEADVVRRVMEYQRLAALLSEQQAETLRANQALAHSRNLLASLIQHLPGAVFYTDASHVIRVANEQAASTYGHTAASIIGRNFADIFSADRFPGLAEEAAQLRQAFLKAVEPQRLHAYSVEVKDASGQVRTSYRDAIAVPVRGPDGVPDGVLSISFDVTERVELERLRQAHIERLEAADRHKDEFLSVISHELRTPLNFIMGFASVLEDELYGPLNPQQTDAVGRILLGADRMLKLVNDLLEFARIQAGAVELLLAPTELAPLVEEVVSTLAPLAHEKGITLDAVVERPCVLPLDAPRLIQVLTNVVGNGIKFTPAGGTVCLHASRRGPDVVLDIRDSGIGIAQADLPRLFERFRQLDMSATRAAGGVGLGLAISKSLVEAHGGRIEVQSAPGAGSTFSLFLPADPAAMPSPHPREPGGQ